MKYALVLALMLTLLIASVSTSAYAQSCSNPGAGSTTDYTYDSAENTYVICNVLSAQATIMAYTPTPTPTLLPTPAAVMASTGCNPYDKQSLYQSCVIDDASTRNNAYTFWAVPAIFFLLLIFGVAFNSGKFHRA